MRPSPSSAVLGGTCWLTARAASVCAVSRCRSRPRPTLPSTRRPGSPVPICSRTSAAAFTGTRQRGFPGCTVYDCFGAGQRVSRGGFGGLDWRQAPRTAQQMFEVFGVIRQLHELLWYLTEALTLQPARPLHAELGRALEETERLADNSPDTLVELDVAAHRRGVNALLSSASELVRARIPSRKRTKVDHSGADLIGADLRRADLRGASLKGAALIGADLRGADLRVADFIGADLRGADLSGADLTGSIFLTQSQLTAANGDTQTRVPPSLGHPTHWVRSGG